MRHTETILCLTSKLRNFVDFRVVMEGRTVEFGLVLLIVRTRSNPRIM